LDSFPHLFEHHHDGKLLAEKPPASLGASEEVFFFDEFEFARLNEASNLLLIAFLDTVLPH